MLRGAIDRITKDIKVEYTVIDVALWILFLISASSTLWTGSALVWFRAHPGEFYLRGLTDPDHIQLWYRMVDPT